MKEKSGRCIPEACPSWSMRAVFRVQTVEPIYADPALMQHPATEHIRCMTEEPKRTAWAIKFMLGSCRHASSLSDWMRKHGTP